MKTDCVAVLLVFFATRGRNATLMTRRKEERKKEKLLLISVCDVNGCIRTHGEVM